MCAHVCVDRHSCLHTAPHISEYTNAHVTRDRCGQMERGGEREREEGVGGREGRGGRGTGSLGTKILLPKIADAAI